MGRPRQVSDDRILEVARQCFLEQGPGVSTTVIAERLGISQAAVFKRFRTKEELMLAALKPPGDPSWAAMVEAGPDDRPVRQQLEEMATEVLKFMDRLVPCIAVLRSSGLDPVLLRTSSGDSPPARSHKLLVRWFERAMARGLVAPGDAESLATAFFSPLQFRAFLHHLHGESLFSTSAEEFSKRIVDVLWWGIAPKDNGEGEGRE